MGICSVCFHVVSKTCLFVLPDYLLNGNTVLHQCNTLAMIGNVCDYVRVCCGSGVRPLVHAGQTVVFSSWWATGWYIPEQTGIDQGQEVAVIGPSPACAPTDRILDRVRWNTFPHAVSAPLWAERRNIPVRDDLRGIWRCLCHQTELVYTHENPQFSTPIINSNPWSAMNYTIHINIQHISL